MFVIMLIFMLLIPLIMAGFGLLFIKRPPKTVNNFYGYRTSRSMKSKAAWDFAQKYGGRFWLYCGTGLIPVSAAAFTLCYGRDFFETAVIVLFAVQMLLMLLVIPLTEAALSKRFDKYGRPKNK